MPKKKLWYVLNVEAGKEVKLRKEITRQSRIHDVKEIGRIIIATHAEERKRKNEWITMNVRSFPGYLILHMRYTDEVFNLLESLRHRGVFGLLPVRPEKPMPPRSRHGIEGKGPAWKKYEAALDDYINWKPTAVETKEMAILMIREKEKGKRKKDKKIRVRPTCDLQENELVRIKGGPYAGLEGVVKKVRESQVDFFVTLNIKVIGREVPLGISHKELERV